MDGFFERYGRMIIVAVAICFVLLYLTPMRNVVGSSINGFAGNFANKVGDSLRTVKMPDGSGGATDSEGVKAGNILKIDGNEYIVLEKKDNNQALVITTSSIGNKTFHENYDYRTQLRSDGQNANTYEGSDIDNYLENEWYNELPNKIKTAIKTSDIKQASYVTNFNAGNKGKIIEKYETGYRGQVYHTISRHVFLPGASDIGKVVDLEKPYQVKTFLQGTSIWTRDSYAGGRDVGEYFSTNSYGLNGILTSCPIYGSEAVRPAFVIDLSKVDYTVEGTTNYK